MLDTSARLLRLLAILPTRPAWTGPELAERLEVTGRTLRRDMNKLRDLGYPVVAAPGVGGGYRLTAGSTLPPLMLDDEEAVAVVLSLRSASTQGVAGIAETSLRALGKLERILPARLRGRTAALRSATVALSDPATAVEPQILTAIAEAAQNHHRLDFEYRDHGGRASTRSVEPHRLVHTGRRWYLVARDVGRDDWRTFRVDRIDGPRDTRIRFTPHDPPDAAAFVSGSVSVAPYRFQARIHVYAPAAVIAEKVSPTSGVVEALDDDRCMLHIGANAIDLMAMHLALLGQKFVVLEPPELVRELGRLAEHLAALYRESAKSLRGDARPE